MSLRFLLDTNIVSEPLRPKPSPGVLRRLQHHPAEMAIAAVVWHELWLGCLRLPPSLKRETIETYLSDVIARTVPVLPYDERAARWHAAERARLAVAGKTPAVADGQIAAIAVVNELTLVTLNPQDFRLFADLVVTNWAS